MLKRYQPLFARSAIDGLTADAFKEFLLFKNNHHWSGLHRMGTTITADMDAFRAALRELLDDDDDQVPIADRLNRLFPGGTPHVKGFGKAVVTAILLVAHPKRYGVWNGTSEGAMRTLQLWPAFERATPLGTRYHKVNERLKQIAQDLHTDLWTLDVLWWRITKPDESAAIDGEQEAEEIAFGLERHLHDFLADNWENTELGKEWDLDQDGGDIKGYGYERSTPIGRIDLLARHKQEARWLVIELKRGRTSDKALGQVQRYMGWVKEELAAPGDQIDGLIIGHEDDTQLRYALKVATNVAFRQYKVDFQLLPAMV